MKNKISQYEYLLATTPAEEIDSEPEDASEEVFRLAASMVREALRLAAEVAVRAAAYDVAEAAQMKMIAELGNPFK